MGLPVCLHSNALVQGPCASVQTASLASLRRETTSLGSVGSGRTTRAAGTQACSDIHLLAQWHTTVKLVSRSELQVASSNARYPPK